MYPEHIYPPYPNIIIRLMVLYLSRGVGQFWLLLELPSPFPNRFAVVIEKCYTFRTQRISEETVLTSTGHPLYQRQILLTNQIIRAGFSLGLSMIVTRKFSGLLISTVKILLVGQCGRSKTRPTRIFSRYNLF